MKKLLWIIIVLLGLAVAWYLISPALINTSVDETLPTSIFESTQMEVTVINSEDEVVEGAEEGAQNQESEIEIEEMPKDIIIGQDVVMNEPMMEMNTTETSIEKRGSFQGADNFHKGSGDLVVVKDGNSQFIRFENFSVTNGPDLFVTLNKGDGPNGDHVIVEALKGNQGSQNYDVSA